MLLIAFDRPRPAAIGASGRIRSNLEGTTCNADEIECAAMTRGSPKSTLANGLHRSLAGVDLLSMIPPGHLADIERGCQWENHEPGSWLFERGQENQPRLLCHRRHHSRLELLVFRPGGAFRLGWSRGVTRRAIGDGWLAPVGHRRCRPALIFGQVPGRKISAIW